MNRTYLNLGRLGMLAALVLSVVCGTMRAQTLPPPPSYKFDVASIRPSNLATDSNRLSPTQQGGLRGENVTGLQLIAFAYDLPPFQIADTPGWAEAQRFDIAATPDRPEPQAGSTPPLDRIRQRTQSLLADRFGLVLHADQKEMPVYTLTLAKGGAKLTLSAEGASLHMESNPVSIRASAVGMNVLARTLTKIVQRPVRDETGLTGLYDLKLEWATQPPADGSSAENSAASLFAAIQEQLGLKLDAGRALISVFVIDQIKHPSEN